MGDQVTVIGTDVGDCGNKVNNVELYGVPKQFAMVLQPGDLSTIDVYFNREREEELLDSVRWVIYITK